AGSTGQNYFGIKLLRFPSGAAHDAGRELAGDSRRAGAGPAPPSLRLSCRALWASIWTQIRRGLHLAHLLLPRPGIPEGSKAESVVGSLLMQRSPISLSDIMFR